MSDIPAFTPNPARVHARGRELTGHHPRWVYRPYRGEIYSIAHFRICSWCGSIHPVDLMTLLRSGRSRFEPTAKKGKFLLHTPNPVAGDLVRMGTVSGRVFNRAYEPRDIRHRLTNAKKTGLVFEPSAAERLSGHFERSALETAPAMIVWPFYAEHTTDRQWLEILEASENASG